MRPLDRAAKAPRPEAPSPGRKEGSVEQERHARRIPPIPRGATTGIGSSGAPPRPAPIAGADGPAQPPAPPGAGRPLDPRPPQAGRAEPPACGEGHARILALLGPTPVEEDAVWRDTGLARAAFAALLTELELDGAIRRAPGGLLSRAG
jgi:DNA processing protein